MIYTNSRLIFLFIRYVKGHAPSSMNLLATQLSSYANILKKLNRKYHIVISNEGEGEGPEVSFQNRSVNLHFANSKQVCC